MKQQQGGKILLIIAIVIAAVGAFAWYTHQQRKQSQAAVQALQQAQQAQAAAELAARDQASAQMVAQLVALQKITEQWDDAMAVAQSSSRVTLGGPVQDLQSIRREASGQPVPACFADAKRHLIMGFNPHPPSRAGDPLAVASFLLLPGVSIHTRPRGRVIREAAGGGGGASFVSIHTRPRGRVIRAVS